MRRRWPAASILVALVATSCFGSFDPATADPEDIDSCEHLASALVALVADYVEVVERQPIAALLDTENPPEELTLMTARGAALGARSIAIGCAASELRAIMEPGLAEITPEGVVGQRYLEIVLETAGLGPP